MSEAVMETGATSAPRRTSPVPNAVVTVLAALAIVAGVACGVRGLLVWATEYYGGQPGLAANYVRFRNDVLAMAERALWIQGQAGGRVEYAWGQGVGSGTRYVRTAAGGFPMREVRAGPLPRGRAAVAGYVENGTGAVVLAVAGESRGSGRLTMLQLSPLAQAAGSVAWRPGEGAAALPDHAAVDAAAWEPVEGAADRWADTSETGTMLLRFDRVPAGAAPSAAP